MTEKLEASSDWRGGVAVERGGVPRGWVRFLRAHSATTARMDATLRAAHGISLREYEILLALVQSPDRRLRRVDLAAMVLLTQSGVTRTLEPLERRGLVGREQSSEDRRVTYATLTAEGDALIRAAARTHLADIRDLFADRYSTDELNTLDALLERLPGAGGEGEWRAT
jgi:DNA-binding MarR family transcriptional regulator